MDERLKLIRIRIEDNPIAETSRSTQLTEDNESPAGKEVDFLLDNFLSKYEESTCNSKGTHQVNSGCEYLGATNVN